MVIILTGSLERILPQLKFVDITEHELHNFNKYYKEEKTAIDKDTEMLISDNSLIGPLIYNEQLPFKFIQV